MSWSDWMRYDPGSPIPENSENSISSSSNYKTLKVKYPTICKCIEGNLLNSYGKGVVSTYLQLEEWTQEDIAQTLEDCEKDPKIAKHYLLVAVDLAYRRQELYRRKGILGDTSATDWPPENAIFSPLGFATAIPATDATEQLTPEERATAEGGPGGDSRL